MLIHRPIPKVTCPAPTRGNAWGRWVEVLDRKVQVDWVEGFADGTFASAKKGAIWSARPSGARGRLICDRAADSDPLCERLAERQIKLI